MQLDHVTLAVRDLARSVRFYSEVIGLEPLASPTGDGLEPLASATGGGLEPLASATGGATLGIDGRPRLDLVERPNGEPRGDRAGLFHVAWLLASRAHLGAALARLAAAGSRLTGAADHHVSEAVYLDDPDGHGIELYADRPEATWRQDGRIVMTNSRLDLDDLGRAATAAGLEAEASTRGATLGHLHLEATDLAASRRFAVEELGLELQADWPHAAFLAWRGYHHHLAYNDWNNRSRPLDPDADSLGLIHIRLKSDRPSRTLTDPNGIRFELA